MSANKNDHTGKSAERGLRLRLTKYGDDDFALFLRQAFLKAKGLDAEAFSRPIVGICDTGSDFNPCHATVPALVKAISRGVEMAGGLPMAFPTISLHESFSFPTSMYLRNLMSMDVEEMLNALPLDAVVLIGGCDKTVPAQLMGAISANVPTVGVVVGPMLTGAHEGERLGACTDCRRLWSEYRAGTLAADDLARAHDRLMPSHGTCMVMGTASTMACISEVLGFMLPGSASIPAVHSEALRNATAAGRRAVDLANCPDPVRPSDLVTKTSIRNAVTTLQALGGSTNAVIHLMAIARRAGVDLDLEQVDAIGRRTPVLSNLKPVGTHYMEDFHTAGGLPALLRNLRTAATDFDDSALAGDGRRWGEVLSDWPAWSDGDVVRTPTNPVLAEGALVVLRGSVAPDGAVIKRAGIADPGKVREGPALVFRSLKDLENRIDDPDLEVTADHVLVLQGAGPIGAPGMPKQGPFRYRKNSRRRACGTWCGSLTGACRARATARSFFMSPRNRRRAGHWA